MAESVGGIIDTSIFIGLEQGRPMRSTSLTGGWAVSVVTLAELRLAVLNARDTADAAMHLLTLEKAERRRSIPIDETIAFHWAVLRSAARSLSQSRANDLWIAATALALRVPVITQDEGFARLEQVGGPQVILV